jgi:biotin synthase-related radical SAM superfamily protein
MDWIGLKARLLESGTARLAGHDARPYISSSTAGPGAGTSGSVFFSTGNGSVRLALDPGSPVTIQHTGGGTAVLQLDGQRITGILEPVALHCPRQAYLTVTGGCVYRCRYCEVPAVSAGRKTPEEIRALVDSVADDIDAIAITSGVFTSVSEEEDYVVSVIQSLPDLGVPVGVSIFPGENTAQRLYDAGVAEVKFNLETATRDLFSAMCPGLDRDTVWRAIARSVPLFGKGHVFSNIIVGLGESDDDLEKCIRKLCAIGVIPVIRPLTPAGELSGYPRPPAERLIHIQAIHARALREAGLDPRAARTMCVKCTGCDLVPGRDAPL